MNDPLKNIRDEAKKIRLSHDEKAYMRAQIFNMIERKNAQVPAYHPTRTPYFFFAPRFAMPFAAFLLLTFGTTTTYAAQGALPGNFLYPVKIYVNENIQAALAVSDEAKLSYHTNIAQERLEEAEALASEGKLDATTTSELEESFSNHATAADKIATDLEENDPANGVEARITLNSSLSAHAAILTRIGEDSKDEQTKENSFAFAGHTHFDNEEGRGITLKSAVSIAAMPLSNSEATSDNATSGVQNIKEQSKNKVHASLTATTSAQKNIALQLQKKVKRQLSDIQDLFNESKFALDATTTNNVTLKLAQLNSQFAIGTAQIQAQDYTGARATLSAALKKSIELQAFIQASKTYKRDLIRSSQDDNEGNPQDNRNSGEGNSNHYQKAENHGSGIQVHLEL